VTGSASPSEASTRITRDRGVLGAAIAWARTLVELAPGDAGAQHFWPSWRREASDRSGVARATPTAGGACSASSCGTRGAGGRCSEPSEKFQMDSHWRDHLLFYEYFHGDNGAGIGASHQTGWTGLVAALIQLFGTLDAREFLEGGKKAAFDRG
jgi:hypothetical protein